jgi:hypothetical protein
VRGNVSLRQLKAKLVALVLIIAIALHTDSTLIGPDGVDCRDPLPTIYWLFDSPRRVRNLERMRLLLFGLFLDDFRDKNGKQTF